VHGIFPITSQALAKRTPEYRAWVEGYARKHKIPMKSPEKDESKEQFVRGRTSPEWGLLAQALFAGFFLRRYTP